MILLRVINDQITSYMSLMIKLPPIAGYVPPATCAKTTHTPFMSLLPRTADYRWRGGGAAAHCTRLLPLIITCHDDIMGCRALSKP